MIKIENVEVVGWEAAIRGMRNPLNSWTKSDTVFSKGSPEFGPNDMKLMKRLRNAGTDHRKFMRMITVYADITAPLYWLAEFDTYKIGTVRNSCSFMHKGVSVPYGINDFSLKDEHIYDILSDLEMKKYELTYPYETNEYKMYTARNGRNYRVYRNGRVIREAFDYVDAYETGRKRHFEAADATIYQNKSGYFIVRFSGRGSGSIPLHRLVAECWIDKPEGAWQVDHLNANKGDNSVENLEWVTPAENMRRAVDTGLYDNLKSLHRIYKVWKNNSKVIPTEKRMQFKLDADSGMSHKELATKYNILPIQANNVRYLMNHSEHEDLFQECLIWERLIDCLNNMRELYLDTKDEKVFQQIRALMPQGYMQRSTFMLNYEVLANMYNSRKHHRLDEWRELCDWMRGLPYSELITGEFVE